MKKIISALIIGMLFLSPLKTSAACSTCTKCAKKNVPAPIENFYGTFPNKIELIFSDIDGTILRFDKKNPKVPIPIEVKKSIRQLKASKIPLILVTGRSYAEASEMAQEMENDNIFIATNQGAEIRDSKGNLIHLDAISKEDTQKIYDTLLKYKKENNMTFNICFFANGKLYSDDGIKLPYNWEEMITIKSLDDIGENIACSKIVLTETNPEKLRQIQSFAQKSFPKYKIVISASCYCDISNPNATKGNAVRKMAKLLNVDLKNTAVFGDAENDASMLSLVKKSGGAAIAVKNAMPELKENANYETLSVYDCGFSYAVKKILKNNARLNSSTSLK